jgi:hypothetical protein
LTDQIYIENGVGRAVMEAINLFTPKHGVTAVWQHDVHPEMQRKQYGDEWWIETSLNVIWRSLRKTERSSVARSAR